MLWDSSSCLILAVNSHSSTFATGWHSYRCTRTARTQTLSCAVTNPILTMVELFQTRELKKWRRNMGRLMGNMWQGRIKRCLILTTLRFLQHLREYYIRFPMTPNFWTLNCNFWRWCLFRIIFFIFYKIFCSISPNKPGRHNNKVPFAVMCHILCVLKYRMTIWNQEQGSYCFRS